MGCTQPVPTRTTNTCKSMEKLAAEFVVHLNTQQSENGIHEDTNGTSLNKRLVFCSLVGLFQTYKQTPMVLLYPAICILPLKSEWIDDPVKYTAELNNTIIAQMPLFYHDPLEFALFWRLLQWKKQQNLLFCMLDCYEEDAEQTGQIAPFWLQFSRKLVSMKLNGLQCLFKRPRKFESKYNCKYIEVFAELCCLRMQFKSIQEIIHQTNPDSLLPIVSYTPNREDIGQRATFSASIIDGSEWYIADDYDDEP
eukprot:CAMPEP_0197020988 /NCGR_PEP_ID=MMETSP1384-20130603/1867_1 /TAXON_ID=29189 /ORGANISM="Ammonia sp." /LENGTH=251 /DNA_ID=CAMNT_0042448723 /DNA_START=42 /DNA_END=797 /DNA_ORIENTATION=+